MSRSHRAMILFVAGVTGCLLLETPSNASYAHSYRWDPATATFPVVRVNTCSNTFSSYFPSQPWVNVRGQAAAAANEWFVGGGADVRLRMYADISGAAECNPNGIPTGSVVLRAEQSTSVCNRAALTVNSVSIATGKIIGGAVILYAGTTGCDTVNHTYQAYTWAGNADYPTNDGNDFRTVITHEFGHALLGPEHSSNPSALMYAAIPLGAGGITRRFLTTEDRDTLRVAPSYSAVQLTSQHRRSTDNGANWLSEGEPALSVAPIGAPAVAWPIGAANAFDYYVAQSRSDTRKLYSYRSDGVGSYYGVQHNERTYLTPGSAAGASQALLAFVNADVSPSLQWKVSSDGGATWSSPRSTGYSTEIPPALAYVPWNGAYLLFWVDKDTGFLRSVISTDGGATFSFYQEWNAFRADTHVGLICQSSGGYCALAWPDASVAYTKLQMAVVRMLGGGSPALYVDSPVYNLGYDTYGVSVASNDNRFQFAWRDRGNATVLATGGWPWPPTLDTVDFTAITTHAPPSIAFGAAYNEWSSWYSFGSSYDK